MEFNLEVPQNQFFIRSVSEKGICVDKDFYDKPFILSGKQIITGWGVASIDDINETMAGATPNESSSSSSSKDSSSSSSYPESSSSSSSKDSSSSSSSSSIHPGVDYTQGALFAYKMEEMFWSGLPFFPFQVYK